MFPQLCALLTLFLCVQCTIISRNEWAAKAVSKQALAENPPRTVVIHHSAGPTCNSAAECKTTVKSIQNYHINTKQFRDIGYNFLVGSDGSVLEGRGWGARGAHDPRYNRKSIGICFIGNFVNSSPTEAQLAAAKSLISGGVEEGKIASNFQLIGHRQSKSTECPGQKLYDIIKTWPHYVTTPS